MEQPGDAFGRTLIRLEETGETRSIESASVLAAGRARSTDSPSQWKMRSLTAPSLALGLLVALEDRLAIWIGLRRFRLSFARFQTLARNTRVRMLMVRERRHFWFSAPAGICRVLRPP